MKELDQVLIFATSSLDQINSLSNEAAGTCVIIIYKIYVSVVVLICPVPTFQSPFNCQIWYGENVRVVNKPFPPSFGWPQEQLLTEYNKKPTAIIKMNKRIKSFKTDGENDKPGFDQGKWITVATLPYVLSGISVISLDSGDVLIIGFQPDFFAQSPRINKLHDGKITRIGTFDEVCITCFNRLKFLDEIQFSSSFPTHWFDDLFLE